MRTGSGLYELIQSMSASEKRYFKVFASRHTQKGKNHYMDIFEIMNAQSSYDEAFILQKLPDDKARRQFPVMKNYLYKLVLKSLRNFHSGRTIDFRLKELLMNAELLQRRGLHNQCFKQLEKTRQLALAHEKFEYLLEVGAMQLSLAMETKAKHLERLEHSMDEIFADTNRWFDHYRQIQAFRKLSLQMLLLNRREQHISNQEVRSAYEKIIGDPIMLDLKGSDPVRAHFFAYQSQFIYHFAAGDQNKAFDYVSRIVEVLEDNPHLVEERQENYVHSLQNMVVISTLCRPPEESLRLIDRLKGFADRFPKVKFSRKLHSNALLFAYNVELQLLLGNRKMEQAADLLPELIKLLENNELRYNLNEGYVLLALYLQIANVYLYLKDFDRALSFVNRILNQEGMNEEYELYLYTRIMRVMIMFDAGDIESLEYALQSLHRFLNKRKKKYRFEKALLKFLRRSFELADRKAIVPHLQKLQDELQSIIEDPEEPYHIRHFGIMAWLDQHLPPAEKS
jgi:tetratricopeptide (TPR) repeat protein